jgi:hypothetical protein
MDVLVKSKWMSQIYDEALQHIEQDRQKNADVYKAIEDYCAQNELFISNASVIADEQTKQSIMDKKYNIYTTNALFHANELTNELHKKLSEKSLIKMKTVENMEEFSIEYNFQIVAVVYKLQKQKIDYKLVLQPVQKKLLYFPPEIEIIDTYHKLYTEQDVDESLKLEDKLCKLVYERLDAGILGGLSCADKKREQFESIKISLILDWLPKQNAILLGVWAYDWLIKTRKSLCVNVEKIQIISSMKPNDLLVDLQKYVSQIGKIYITMREQELHIPKDFRTMRYTYYMKIKTDKGEIEKPFLDLFNSGNFEIVPFYKVDGLRLGAKWVILRFLYIDLWVIRIIRSLGLLDKSILNIKLASLWKLIEYFRSTELSIDDYIGEYRDAAVDKKMSKLSQTKKFYPYNPDAHFKEHGKYRVLQ